MMDLKTPYLYQADDKDSPVANRFSQCGYTSAIMLMSQYLGSSFCTPQNEAIFLDWMEPSFGLPGIGELLISKDPNLVGKRLGAQIECYRAAIEKWLNDSKIKGTCTVRRGGNWQEIEAQILAGNPVMIGWMPTPDGHFSVIRGFSETMLKLNDPAGSALKGYFRNSTDGDGAEYPREWFRKYSELSTYGLGYLFFNRSK